MKKLIIASTSTVHGGKYLDYITSELAELFKGLDEIVFVPYARPGGITHDEYTAIAHKGFEEIGIRIRGLHTYPDPVEGIRLAKGIFVGGGNTFLLVTELYRNAVMEEIRNVVHNGTPYFGTSAGSNITGLTMQTTNDMPIIYPPSFKTLGLISFNLNPHYLDPDPNSKHMGETRETRIREFHTLNTQPVVGLREGSWLQVEDDTVFLRGQLSARIFEKDKEPYEVEPGSKIVF